MRPVSAISGVMLSEINASSPAACASNRTVGNPSYLEGKIIASAAIILSATSLTFPQKTTLFSNPACLTQASISGVDPESEPSPAELAAVKKVVESTGTTTIFTEELVSPETAQAVAAETGAQTRVLSPIESAPESGDYADAMRANLEELRTALSCQ